MKTDFFSFQKYSKKYVITVCFEERLEDAHLMELILHCLVKAHQLILEKSYGLKKGHIWRTDQNTPRTFYQKDFKSSNEEHNWAILANLNPCKFDDYEARYVLEKPLKTICWCSNQIWIPTANVPVKRNTRTVQLKTQPTVEQSCSKWSSSWIYQHKEEKKNWIQLPSTMSEQ